MFSYFLATTFSPVFAQSKLLGSLTDTIDKLVGALIGFINTTGGKVLVLASMVVALWLLTKAVMEFKNGSNTKKALEYVFKAIIPIVIAMIGVSGMVKFTDENFSDTDLFDTSNKSTFDEALKSK